MSEIREKVGKPYFENLEYKDFNEYAFAMFNPIVNEAIEQNPPVWFATIDQERQTQDDIMKVWERENAVNALRIKLEDEHDS